MTTSEITARRLINQQLLGTAFTDAAAIVRWFGAVQAQEYALSKWALGLRLPHLKEEDVEQAFTRGDILRTHLLRPTWHFVAPEDIRWMLMLTGPHVQAGNAYMYRKTELDAGIFKRCNSILEKILTGGGQLTRPQINEAFKQHKIVIPDGLRLSLVMMQAELDGLICSGARHGAQFTYALLEERVPQAWAMRRDEALATLALRYFTSRGPAAVADFATWSGLPVRDARAGMAMIQEQLTKERTDGQDYYSLAQAINGDHPSGTAHLLSPYDEYIMGYKNRDAIMQIRKGIYPMPTMLFNSMILFEGQVAGSWRRTVHKKFIDITHHFLKPCKQLEQAFEKAVKRFGAFTGLPVNVLNRI